MENWKERLIEEQKQLKERLLKLIDFMNSEKYYSFDDNTKAVFTKQRTGMEIYLSALNVRIFGDTTNYCTSSDLMSLFLMTMFNGNAFASTTKSPEMKKLEELMKEIPIEEEKKDNE